jgi:hypothetical protein
MYPKTENQFNRRMSEAGAARSNRNRLEIVRFVIITAFAILGLCCCLSPLASAQPTANAITMLNGYNSTFLYKSGSTAYYMHGIDDSGSEAGWGLAVEIEVAEDAYETTGNSSDQTLINNLLTGMLAGTPTNSWAGDPWNDDIGWETMALIRGYQMTGNPIFLTDAEYGFNMAFARGWDTTYNGGGIWENFTSNPPGKNILSNHSLGKVAAMIYQSTGNTYYLSKSEQIYSWIWHTLFVPSTGQVYTAINTNGTLDTSECVYNQGTFIDYANIMYELGAGSSYLSDAISAINFTTNNLSTDINTTPTTYNVINNTQPWQNFWADEFSRGLGHVCGYTPSLWGRYYWFMTNNCAYIWNNRLTPYNITWNGWAQPTPLWINPGSGTNADPMVYGGAVAMELYTPAATPPIDISGTHYLVNKFNGLALDNPDDNLDWGTDIDQESYSGGANDNWTFSENNDGSYTIVNLGSGLALDDSGASTTQGAKVDEWLPNGTAAQKWVLTPIQDGCYKIENEASGLALEDPSFSSATNTLMDQWSWNGGANQEWRLLNDPRAGLHVIVNEANALVIDNAASDTEGSGVHQWEAVAGTSQQNWTFTMNTNSSWAIVCQNSGYLLDDPGSSATSGEQMDQWPANDGANQKWWVDANSDGSYTIWNEASNDVLDSDSQNTNGTPLIQWPYLGNTNQKWYLEQ